MAHKDCNCGNDHNHDHGHSHDHECGCGHDHNQGTVTISLDGETEVECGIIGTFDVNNKEYIALLPLEDEEVLIFSFVENNGEVELSNIETDEEYEAVSNTFNELFLVGDDLDDEDDFDDDDDDFDDDFDDDDDEDIDGDVENANKSKK